MKILITGGAGFIGSHLTSQLINRGEEIICVDNLSTGHFQNVSSLEKNARFKFVNADVTQSLPKNLGEIRQIYHLASPASPAENNPRGYHALWQETMRVNTIGTWNLVELAVKNKARLLFTSTSEIYGDPLEHPQSESYRGNVSSTGPRAVYDEAKRFGETIVSAYVKNRGLDGRIVRIFNTYGPRMDLEEGRVVYNLIKAAIRNEEIPIYGDGKQTRSFCYVDDLINGLIKLMDKDGLAGEVVNLGNPKEFTILELAQKIINITGSKSTMIFLPLPKDDPTKRKPDVSKAKKLLDWEAKINLDQGLEETVRYVRNFLKK